MQSFWIFAMNFQLFAQNDADVRELEYKVAQIPVFFPLFVDVFTVDSFSVVYQLSIKTKQFIPLFWPIKLA